MKVLLLNGSPHAKGCTYTALAEAAGALEAAGVETEFVHIGTKAIRGCIGCGKCREAKRCVFDDDPVNEAIEKARACDGFIFGSPVYYASPNGAALAFLDRLFYAGGSALRYKPGAAVVSARRSSRNRKKRRDDGFVGRAEQIFYHQLYAGGIFKILEHGAWQHAR